MIEVAGFVLNLSFLSDPSVGGVLKSICEPIAFVLNVFFFFWGKCFQLFFKNKSQGEDEKNKRAVEYLGDAVPLEIGN